MSISRRSFVHTAAITMLAGAALPEAFSQTGFKGTGGQSSAANPMESNPITMKGFEPLIGQSFAVLKGEKTLGSVRMIGVQDMAQTEKADPYRFMVGKTPAAAPPQPTISFAVHFQGQGKEMPQDTYTLRNARVGDMTLFIVPSGPGTNPVKYTASFSLLSTGAAE